MVLSDACCLSAISSFRKTSVSRRRRKHLNLKSDVLSAGAERGGDLTALASAAVSARPRTQRFGGHHTAGGCREPIPPARMLAARLDSMT